MMKFPGVNDHNSYKRFIANQPQYSQVSRQMDREENEKEIAYVTQVGTNGQEEYESSQQKQS